MKNNQFFNVEDHNDIIADHVFYSHLKKRDNLVAELESLEIKTLKHHFDEIAFEDYYLTEYIKARNIYGIAISNDIKNYEPFDIEHFKETLLDKNDLSNSLWVIASDLREMKKQGLFKSYRAAYRHGAKRLTVLGRKVTWQNLETAYSKYKTEGRKD
jgi:hypothetical protein